MIEMIAAAKQSGLKSSVMTSSCSEFERNENNVQNIGIVCIPVPEHPGGKEYPNPWGSERQVENRWKLQCLDRCCKCSKLSQGMTEKRARFGLDKLNYVNLYSAKCWAFITIMIESLKSACPHLQTVTVFTRSDLRPSENPCFSISLPIFYVFRNVMS